MKFTATVKGFKQAEITLKALAEKIERGAMRQALSKAATPIVKAARQMAPVDSKALRKSIGKKVFTDVKSGIVQVKIAPRTGKAIEYKGRKRNPVRYAHLIEFGSSRNRAQPFMRPAHDATKDESRRIYKEAIAEAIKSNARRLKKRYKP